MELSVTGYSALLFIYMFSFCPATSKCKCKTRTLFSSRLGSQCVEQCLAQNRSSPYLCCTDEELGLHVPLHIHPPCSPTTLSRNKGELWISAALGLNSGSSVPWSGAAGQVGFLPSFAKCREHGLPVWLLGEGKLGCSVSASLYTVLIQCTQTEETLKRNKEQFY